MSKGPFLFGNFSKQEVEKVLKPEDLPASGSPQNTAPREARPRPAAGPAWGPGPAPEALRAGPWGPPPPHAIQGDPRLLSIPAIPTINVSPPMQPPPAATHPTPAASPSASPASPAAPATPAVSGADSAAPQGAAAAAVPSTGTGAVFMTAAERIRAKEREREAAAAAQPNRDRVARGGAGAGGPGRGQGGARAPGGGAGTAQGGHGARPRAGAPQPHQGPAGAGQQGAQRHPEPQAAGAPAKAESPAGAAQEKGKEREREKEAAKPRGQGQGAAPQLAPALAAAPAAPVVVSSPAPAAQDAGPPAPVAATPAPVSDTATAAGPPAGEEEPKQQSEQGPLPAQPGPASAAEIVAVEVATPAALAPVATTTMEASAPVALVPAVALAPAPAPVPAPATPSAPSPSLTAVAPAAPGPAASPAPVAEPQDPLRSILAAATPGAQQRFPNRGLINTGNTCFMNSTMQALLSLPSFCLLLRRLAAARDALVASKLTVLAALGEFGDSLARGENPVAAVSGAAGNGNGNGSIGNSNGGPGSSWAGNGTGTGTGNGAEGPSHSNGASAPATPPYGGRGSGSGLADKERGPAGFSLPPPSSGPGHRREGSSSSGKLHGSTLQPISPQVLDVVVSKFRPAAAPAPKTGWAAVVHSAPAPNGRAAQGQAAAQGSNEQEDAEEFLLHLIDAAHEELIKLQQKLGLIPTPPPDAPKGTLSAAAAALSGASSPSPSASRGAGAGGGQSGAASRAQSPPASPASQAEEEWSTVGKKNKAAIVRTTGVPAAAAPGAAQGPGAAEAPPAPLTPVITLFGGAMRSVVKAPNAKPSATIQPFNVLQLDINFPDIHTIEDAISHLTRAEEVTYKPDGPGGVEGVAEKSQRLLFLPEALVLHVKRFAYDMTGEGMMKIHKPVKFSTTLRLKPSVLADTCPYARRGGCDYELAATITHHGKTPTGGHYTADCLQPDGTWLRFDDTRVYPVPLREVLMEQAYLLLYRRLSLPGQQPAQAQPQGGAAGVPGSPAMGAGGAGRAPQGNAFSRLQGAAA